MNLICGCTGKGRSTSDRSTTTESQSMSSLRQRNAGATRFGFSRAVTVNQSALKVDSSTSDPALSACNGSSNKQMTPQTGNSNKNNANATYALNPRSLDHKISLSKNADESKSSAFVPRMKNLQPASMRPQSTIVTISHRKNDEFAQHSSVPTEQFSNDDSKLNGRGKASGLKSFLSRPFQRDARHKPNKTIQSLKKTTPSETRISTKSSSKSSIATSRSKLSLNSLSNSVCDNKCSKPDNTVSLPKEPQKPYRNSQVRQANETDMSGGAVNKADVQVLSSLAQACSSSSIVKPNSTKSRLAFQQQSLTKSSLLSSKAKNSSSICQKKNENQHQWATNIDPLSAVGSTVTITNGSVEHSLATPIPNQIVDSSRPLDNKGEGMIGDKRKPMVEICPIAKSVDLEDEPVGEVKEYGKPGKLITIREDDYLALVDEVVTIRKALVELNHHLIGKQDHDDKVREELQTKTETIVTLQRQLSAGGLCKTRNSGVIQHTDVAAEDT